MDLELIANLVEMVTASSLTSLEIEENGIRIRLENGRLAPVPQAPAAAPQPVVIPAAPAAAVPMTPPAEAPKAGNSEEHLICAPLVGVFYSLASMGREALAPGGMVKKGVPVCAIEAMKLINEIESDIDGEVLEILAKDGDTVEFGQPLLKLRRV